MGREHVTDMLTLELRPKGGNGVTHVDTGNTSNMGCTHPEGESGHCVAGGSGKGGE